MGPWGPTQYSRPRAMQRNGLFLSGWRLLLPVRTPRPLWLCSKDVDILGYPVVSYVGRQYILEVLKDLVGKRVDGVRDERWL